MPGNPGTFKCFLPYMFPSETRRTAQMPAYAEVACPVYFLQKYTGFRKRLQNRRLLNYNTLFPFNVGLNSMYLANISRV